MCPSVSGTWHTDKYPWGCLDKALQVRRGSNSIWLVDKERVFKWAALGWPFESQILMHVGRTFLFNWKAQAGSDRWDEETIEPAPKETKMCSGR